MSYTIIQVERKTGVSSRTLRFWCDNGLFPLVQRDKNGIRYFSQSDIEWVTWVQYFRQMGISIDTIKNYIQLAIKGDSTMQTRLDILKKERKRLSAQLDELMHAVDCMDKKIERYEQAIKKNTDTLNPQSKKYKL